MCIIILLFPIKAIPTILQTHPTKKRGGKQISGFNIILCATKQGLGQIKKKVGFVGLWVHIGPQTIQIHIKQR